MAVTNTTLRQALTPCLARCLHDGQVVMVSVAGQCPQSQRPGLTAAAVLRFLETVKGRA